MKKSKLFSLISCLLVAVMLFTACGAQNGGNGGNESEEVTIKYCNFNSSGGNEETLQKMYEAFVQAIADCEADIFSKTAVAWLQNRDVRYDFEENYVLDE